MAASMREAASGSARAAPSQARRSREAITGRRHIFPITDERRSLPEYEAAARATRGLWSSVRVLCATSARITHWRSTCVDARALLAESPFVEHEAGQHSSNVAGERRSELRAAASSRDLAWQLRLVALRLAAHALMNPLPEIALVGSEVLDSFAVLAQKRLAKHSTRAPSLAVAPRPA